LSLEQKLFNKVLSSARVVVVEHTNSGVKKFRVFGAKFRNRFKNYDTMADVVWGWLIFVYLEPYSSKNSSK